MNKRISRFVLAPIVLSLTVGASAQIVDQEPKLKSLPKLEKRPANEVHLFGTKMTVNVSVDAKGNVTAVNSVDGPGWICPGVVTPAVTALRSAAEAVAKKAKFVPAVVGAENVASNGTLEIEFPVAVTEVKKSQSATDGPMRQGVRTITGSAVATPKEVGPPKRAQEVKTMQGDVDLVRQDLEVEPALPAKLADSSVSGGVLNGKALVLPKPLYPAAARAVRASGAVSISVIIEEGGSVASAEPVSGHPLLRTASRMAACRARFAPTLLEGKPVNVIGVITYNFVR